jgi:SAM-dependent methyltransferase
MTESEGALVTDYERGQQFNAVTRWLHSFRYRNAVDVMRRFQGRTKVVEIGCGLTKLFGVLNPRFDIDYTGIDLNAEHIGIARERHGALPNFRAIAEDAVTALRKIDRADVIFALETLEHFPSNDVQPIIQRVAEMRPKIFVCSVPVEIGPALWLKNVGAFLSGYGRQKSYTWSETFWAGLYNFDKVGPHLLGHRGFDWRWLAQTIRHNMRIAEIRKFPVRYMPAAVSTSVFMICEPRE